MVDCREVWDRCLGIIRQQISEENFNTWFVPIVPSSFANDVLTLELPNSFFYEWIEEHFSGLITKSLCEVCGEPCKARYVVANEKEPAKKHGGIMIEKTNDYLMSSSFIRNNFPDVNNISGLNSKYTFENFIEGDCNKLAKSSSESVAQNPLNNPFNPLMIYGSVGLGKTHLLHAIGNRIKEKYPNKKIIYIQTTIFVDQFINSIRNNNAQEFSSFYSGVDALLLDDVQFLKDKEKTQEILFFVFNQLHQLGKEIVLTSDRPPTELVGLQERLVSRFKWGLTVNMTFPDLETKIAILKSKITDGMQMPSSAIEYIAQRVNSNIRELEGVMITAIAKASSEHNLDIDTLQSIINDISSNDVEIDRISYCVSDYFNISIEDILGQSRKKDIVTARKIAMYFAKKYTKCSLKTIGSLIGNRDHSTVIHAINNIEELEKTEKNMQRVIENINREIRKKLSYKK